VNTSKSLPRCRPAQCHPARRFDFRSALRLEELVATQKLSQREMVVTAQRRKLWLPRYMPSLRLAVVGDMQTGKWGAHFYGWHCSEGVLTGQLDGGSSLRYRLGHSSRLRDLRLHGRLSCQASGTPQTVAQPQLDGPANGSQPFSSEVKSNVIGCWPPSLTTDNTDKNGIGNGEGPQEIIREIREIRG